MADDNLKTLEGMFYDYAYEEHGGSFDLCIKTDKQVRISNYRGTTDIGNIVEVITYSCLGYREAIEDFNQIGILELKKKRIRVDYQEVDCGENKKMLMGVGKITFLS